MIYNTFVDQIFLHTYSYTNVYTFDK